VIQGQECTTEVLHGGSQVMSISRPTANLIASVFVLFCVSLLLLGFVTGCTGQPDGTDEDQPLPPGPVEIPEDLQTLYELHNEARAARQLSSCDRQEDLQEAAQAHATWMASSNTFTHTGVNRSSFSTRINWAGYKGRGKGENISRGYSTPGKAFQGWMNSSGHRNNICNSSSNQMGLGMATSSRGQKYWCAVFGQGVVTAEVSTEEALLPSPLEGP